MEPPHGRFSGGGDSVKYLVTLYALVLTDPYRSGVNKGYARVLARAAGF